MRFTVSPEQHKFFQLQKYLEVEHTLSDGDKKSLMSSIEELRQKSPGYPDENLFRSLPLITSLIKKRGWGQIAADLLHKKPLRLAHDKFFTSFPLLTDPINDESCALLIELKTGRGIFFKQLPEKKKLSLAVESGYLFLELTARYLPEQLHPVVIA